MNKRKQTWRAAVSAAAISASAAIFGASGAVLDGDRNCVGSGAGTFTSGEVVDLNGHKLYIDPAAIDVVTFIDSSSDEKGELHVVVPDGEDAYIDTFGAFGNLKVVKDGAGSLATPSSDVELKCAEGRVLVGGKRPIHRWSFTDGSLADSVGGSTATQVGSASFADNAVTFPGGGNGSCYLNLGNDVIPSSGDVTIELWGKRNAATHQWASMFSIGVNASNNNSLRMAWSNHIAGDGSTDMVYLKKNGSNIFFESNTMTPYTVGTMYHISMRFVYNADGSTTITWDKRNASTGAIEKTCTRTVSSDKEWSLADYAGNPLVLNHGYDNDDEAATYDEVRIWHGALTDAQLTLNAQLGPDSAIAYPSQGRCGTVEISTGATLVTPTNGVECARLTGAGTLAESSSLVVDTLDIAGSGIGAFTIDGSLKVVGDWLFDCGANGTSDRIVGAGTLDLSDANLVPRFTADVSGPWLMATGVTVSDYDQMEVPGSSRVKYTGGNLRLLRPGFIIYVK